MLLKTNGISKQFNGVYALNDVNIELEEGTVHGLVGENGAGKSTLIKILTGVYSLESGEVFWNGEKAVITDPASSRMLGINVIHQDHVLVPSFNAVENIYLGREYPKRHGRIDWKTMRREASDKARELGIELDLKRSAAEMSPPQKTCVEIVRAMMTQCRLLILDEPTASLTNKESEILFGIIEKLKANGVAILYVSHRMDEIFRLTDRITILRNGQVSGVVDTKQTNREELIRLMTEKWTAQEIRRGSGVGEVLLEAEHIQTADGIVRDVSFAARKGEIFGVFGLGGSGRTELLECVYGYRKKRSGEIRLCKSVIDHPSPSLSIRSGMVLICEDRRGKALIMNKNVRENISLSRISHFASAGVIHSAQEKEETRNSVREMDIKTTGTEQPVRELSGGNQQKVAFAKALSTKPLIWLCDEPTQAVDVRTRNEIHRLLRQKAEEGCSVILVTSDLKEMLEIADRIMVLSNGRSREILENRELSAETVLASCFKGMEEEIQ